MGGRVIKSDETSKNANRDALHWLIALREYPDDADVLARFDVWHTSSAENKQAWDDARRLWYVLGETREASLSMAAAPAEGRGKSVFSRPQATPRQIRRLRVPHLATAAAGMVAVCLAVLLQPAMSIWLAADYSTAIAEIRDIRLEDGSVVHLGADSAIEVAFEPTMRRVRLLSGEAFFEVEPDKRRPFQVGAGSVDATVLGTAFDVRMMTDGVAVAVKHGRVGVAVPQAGQELETPLAAGDWVRVAWSGKIERGNDAPELVGGWRTGMLVVKDRPITDVVDEIRRHYNGKIMLVDGELGQQHVTGVYDLKKPVDALRAVAQAHDAHVRQIGSWVTVVSKY